MRRTLAALATTALVAAPLTFAAAPAAHAAGYTKTALRIKVSVADCPTPPDPSYQPTVAADIYKPDGASASNPAPAILTTNGFGGSKSDQAGFAAQFAQHGYVVLSYSGLGFGGSSCRITLDDRQHDGDVGSQLVQFLGGKTGVGFLDGADGSTGPAVLGAPYNVDFVQRQDSTSGLSNDPVVGMIGGSYGGQIQYATTAAAGGRVDTIIPIITWNDLSYSLAPNNTSLPSDTSVTASDPGVGKVDWTGTFFADGQAQGQRYQAEDPNDRTAGVSGTCPEFAPQACTSLTSLAAANTPDQTTIDFLRNASVESYISQIKIPTLLAQGQGDTLFNLQESVATYTALKKQGTPVQLLWQSWGHSNSTPAPGELDQSSPAGTYEGDLFLQWFDYYLKHTGPAPALDFSYFRDYADNGTTEAAVAGAYAHAPAYPVGTPTRLYLSGTNVLTPAKGQVQSGSASFVSPGAQGATSQSYTAPAPESSQPPPSDAPGTFAAYDAAPFKTNTDLVGIPTLDFRVSSPTAQASQQTGPSGQLILFAKTYDVAPDGTKTLVHRLISAMRVPDVTKPIHVDLPGIVHRYLAGHHLELVVAATDASYQNNRVPQTVSIVTDKTNPGVLTVPLVAGGFTGSGSTAGAAAAGSGGGAGSTGGAGATTATEAASGSTLPFTGSSPLLPAAASVALAAGLVVRRRRLASVAA